MPIEQKRYDDLPVPEGWVTPNGFPYTCPSSTVAILVTGGSLNAGGIAALSFGILSFLVEDILGNQTEVRAPIGTTIWGRFVSIDAGSVFAGAAGDVLVGYKG